MGHEVIVAHARNVRLIGESSRKDDQLDARTLARPGRIDRGLLGPVQHRSAKAQIHLTVIGTRAARSALVDVARGLEMAKHKTFTVATNVKVYFCDPQSLWQRGTNENTNGLLRQYFAKRTALSGYTQAELDKVALRLNQRPQMTLGFETPASRLRASVATTR
jgi:IS30 family transposase